jgi:phospholipid/cholesterol/gamma-HCH transport system ATP-binding protein
MPGFANGCVGYSVKMACDGQTGSLPRILIEWKTKLMRQTQNNLVEVRGVTFSRGERRIFDDISLSVPRGRITAIMGPSGIGKTTLLRLIGGQIQPERGQILFDGENVPAMSRSRLFEVRKRMSMLFQSGALFTDLTVFENVAWPLREHTRLPEPLLRSTVMMKLEAVGLRGAAQLMPSELSGGMARRAALARAIALEPDLIMFDEPFVGQDPITMGVLVKLISELNSSLGVTCIVVSHDVPEVMSIADYAYIVADQRIVAQGSPRQLENNADSRVRQFLDGMADGPVPFRYPAGDYQRDLTGSGS